MKINLDREMKNPARHRQEQNVLTQASSHHLQDEGRSMITKKDRKPRHGRPEMGDRDAPGHAQSERRIRARMPSQNVEKAAGDIKSTVAATYAPGITFGQIQIQKAIFSGV